MWASRWVPGLDVHSSWTKAELSPMGILILGLGLEPSPAFMFLELEKSTILFKGRTSPFTTVRSHNWLLSTETHLTPPHWTHF